MDSEFNFKHVIVQAGGKGSRLGYNTANKPKCLVSINGQPMLYNLFESFPAARFYIIGDYQFDVLERYLAIFPPDVSVELIKATGTGTCSGIQDARNCLPSIDTPFLLIWSDLQLTMSLAITDEDKNCVGITNDFSCRWSMHDGTLYEERSSECGVMGLFYFGNPNKLPLIPASGEFVRFLSTSDLELEETQVHGVFEVGTMEALEEQRSNATVSRFFNNVTMTDSQVIKRPKVAEYAHLIDKEINWYQKVTELGYCHVPDVHGYNPLTLGRIDGRHPFELEISMVQREAVLVDILTKLEKLHSLRVSEKSLDDMRTEYISKTIQRFNKVKPMLDRVMYDEYVVNGKRVRNVFYKDCHEYLDELFELIPKPDFSIIHGDSTFSNILIDRQFKTWLIDPRGYFGSQLIYGDPNYDYYKLYYSLVGNYDGFNRKKFSLAVHGNNVELRLPTTPWSNLRSMFYEFTGLNERVVNIAHALIWISLAGYAVDDLDSIYGAFFRGLEILSNVY